MKFASAVFAASLILIAPTVSLASSEGETIIKTQIEEAGFNNPRKIGVMVGARAYCGVEYEQFVEPYKMRIGFTQQTPEHEWNRMIDEAKKTIGVLRKASAPCDAAFKAYLERLSY